MSDLLFGVIRHIGSGLSAQRRKMEAIASNISNSETTRAEDGQPYRKKSVRITQSETSRRVPAPTLRPSMRMTTTRPGHITRARSHSAATSPRTEYRIEAEVVEAPPDRVKMVYDPHHPDADAEGYVAYPDINPVEEMVDMMSASRTYEANIAAMEAFRSMVDRALQI
jgi:flagellar basal-body rod protein FlgC